MLVISPKISADEMFGGFGFSECRTFFWNMVWFFRRVLRVMRFAKNLQQFLGMNLIFDINIYI